jgi:hypothetical protein
VKIDRFTSAPQEQHRAARAVAVVQSLAPPGQEQAAPQVEVGVVAARAGRRRLPCRNAEQACKSPCQCVPQRRGQAADQRSGQVCSSR